MLRNTVLKTCTFLVVMASPVLLAQQRFLLEDTDTKDSQSTPFEAGQKDYCAAVVRGGAIVPGFSPTTFLRQRDI